MNDTMRLERPENPGSRKLPQFFAGIAGREASAEGLDLREIFAVFRRRKAVIAGCAILVTALAAIYVQQLTPRYTATSSLMLEQQKIQVLDIKNVMSGLDEGSAVVATQVEILNSPTIGTKVAAKLHLENTPEFNPSLAPASGFHPIDWIANQISSLLGGTSAQDQAPEPRPLTATDIGPAVAGHVVATNDGLSFIIKIRAQSESPELAMQIANTYVDMYLLDQLEAKFDATRRASAWLNEHMADLREKVLNSERAVQLFKEQNNLTQSGTTVTAQQLSELNSQLIIAAADRAQKESALREMQTSGRSSGSSESSRSLGSAPLLQVLRQQEADLLRRQAELSTRYKPAHPTMINLQAQIRDVHQKIQQETGNAVRSLADELNVARAREASLRQTLNSLQHSTTQQDKAQVQLAELQREAQANKALYEDFLNRFKQTTVQEDIQQPDARLVAAATLPGGPSYPNKTLFMTISVAVAIFAGILVAFILERLDNGFRTSDQLEKQIGLATLGMVPALAAGRNPHEVVVAEPVSQYSESVRSVRTSLRYSDVDNPPKAVLVTSSLPAEGKTVFTTSLARSVARSGARALLIDCDFRRPGVARLLGLPEGPGLVDLFDQSATLETIIHVDEESGMHFIVARGGTANPQDILGSQHMRTFLEQMRTKYDLIALDSPPVLAVSDPIILSHSVDTTIYIVQWEKTPRQVVIGAVKMLKANGGHIAGAVLSRVNTRKHRTYGYGDSAYIYGRDSAYYRRA